MARFFDLHPENPQARRVTQIADILHNQGLIAYPTDSLYALGCSLGNREGKERILRLRGLDERHDFTLVCANFSQMGQFVHISNRVFRAVNKVTPGAYTFIFPATKEVPRQFMHPRKKTVGVRIPDHRFVQALLEELGQPILSSTLILPDQTEPLIHGWDIKELLDHALDAVVECGDVGGEPTTVVEFVDDAPVIHRHGAGDVAPFQ